MINLVNIKSGYRAEYRINTTHFDIIMSGYGTTAQEAIEDLLDRAFELEELSADAWNNIQNELLTLREVHNV